MEKHHKFSIWYILIAVWVVILLHDVLVTAFKIEHIPYSEFIVALEEGRVIEVAVTADRIQGKIRSIKNGHPVEEVFTTVRVDQDLSALLKKHEVTFKGVTENTFLKNLASWIFPIFLFVGIWYFLMRRLATQQGSFLTLGKNKAKVYMEDEVGVTFEDVAGVDEAQQELTAILLQLR